MPCEKVISQYFCAIDRCHFIDEVSREVGAAQFWSFLPVSSFNVMNSVGSGHEICFRIWRRRGDSNSRYP